MSYYISSSFELQYAINNRDISHVSQVLIKEEDLLNAVCLGEDQTPLAYASMLGFTDIARFLVDRGADVNLRMSRDGYTALFWAVMGGHIEAVRFLVASGAKVNLYSYDGETVFDQVPEEEDVDLTEIYEYLEECMGDEPFSDET